MEKNNQNQSVLINKMAMNFIDFYIICNPKNKYDESTIKTLVTFVNSFGLNKNYEAVNDRVKSIITNMFKSVANSSNALRYSQINQ